MVNPELKKALLTTTRPSYMVRGKVDASFMVQGQIEPVVVVQYNGEPGGPRTYEEQRKWFRRQARKAQLKGVTFQRFCIHQTIPFVLLYEGWMGEPRDQGAPRWQPIGAEGLIA